MAKGRRKYIDEHDRDGSNAVSFSLIDESTVKRLQKEGKVKVPAKKIDVPKDKRWNEKQMGSKLLQGIMNGDSIDSIAKSLKEVIGNNQASAVRNARTMTTSAECNGRLDSYKDLEEQGVVQKKVWIATPDDRTRESHLMMDGEEVDIDEEFSNGCQFPGDESCGEPSEVWNCRCSMRSHIVGIRNADGSIDYIDYDRDDTMHDKQIEDEKENREGKEEKQPNEFYDKEKARLDDLSGGKLGAELNKTGMFDKEELVAAMKAGTLDDYKNEYLDALKENGDVTIRGESTKNNDTDGVERNPRERMEEDIKDKALRNGMTEDEVNRMFDETDRFFSNEWNKAKTEDVDKFVDLAPKYDGKISRGMHFDSAEDFDKFMKDVDKGSVISMNGKNSSWTSDMSVARRYAHAGDSNVNSVVVICDKNVSSAAVNKYARYSDECEVLAKSNTRWTVTKTEVVTQENGVKKAVVHVMERTKK